MLGALLVFLAGCLILAVVLYVFKLILGVLELPPPVAQIALLIIGLIGLVVLIFLALRVLDGGFTVVRL